jgi:hypothetical protein
MGQAIVWLKEKRHNPNLQGTSDQTGGRPRPPSSNALTGGLLDRLTHHAHNPAVEWSQLLCG